MNYQDEDGVTTMRVEHVKYDDIHELYVDGILMFKATVGENGIFNMNGFMFKLINNLENGGVVTYHCKG